MTMPRICAGGLAAVVLVGSAGADPEAHERLMKAAEAVTNAKSLTFFVQFEMEGTFASMFPKIEMQVSMRRRASGGWELRREGRATGAVEKNFSIISNPSTSQWIDYDAKTVYERYTRQARSNSYFSLAEAAMVPGLADRQPYAKDLEAAESRLEGTVEIDGVLCEIVYVDEGENRQKRRWYFSVADHLPRRLEAIMSGEGFSSTSRYNISDVSIDEELPDDLFNFETPPGFSEQRLPKPAVSAPDATTGLTPPTVSGPPTEAAVARRPAPAFELKDHRGQAVSKEAMEGKVVVLVFGGTWWSQWDEVLDRVRTLHEKYKDQGVEFVAMTVKQRDPQDAVERFTKADLPFRLVTGADEVARNLGVRSYPTFIVIDRAWWIFDEVKGYTPDNDATMNELSSKIDRCIASPEAGDDQAQPAPANPGGQDATTTSEGGRTRTRTGGGEGGG